MQFYNVQDCFCRFYWFVNIGSSIAQSLVVYVQQQIGFDVGYLIPAVSMILSVVLFTAAKNKYLHQVIKGIHGVTNPWILVFGNLVLYWF